MRDGVYKHFHLHPIFILHTKFELMAENVWKPWRWVAVPVMTSVGSIAHWFSMKRKEFGTKLCQNAAFVLNVM